MGSEPGHGVLTGPPEVPRSQDWGGWSPASQGAGSGSGSPGSQRAAPGPARPLIDMLSLCVGVTRRKLAGPPSPVNSGCPSASSILAELRMGSLLLLVPGGTGSVPRSPGCSTTRRPEAAGSQLQPGDLLGAGRRRRQLNRFWHFWLCPQLTFSCSWAFLAKSESRFCHVCAV